MLPNLKTKLPPFADGFAHKLLMPQAHRPNLKLLKINIQYFRRCHEYTYIGSHCTMYVLHNQVNLYRKL